MKLYSDVIEQVHNAKWFGSKLTRECKMGSLTILRKNVDLFSSESGFKRERATKKKGRKKKTN